MGGPRRVSEPHAGGGWTTRVVDAPRPEARVGRACVPVDHENLERFGWSERTDGGGGAWCGRRSVSRRR